MQGKITLEEHFALAETFTNTMRFSNGLAEDLRRRLMDLQGDRLNHGCSPDGMKAQVRITRPTSPKGSLHSLQWLWRPSIRPGWGDQGSAEIRP